MLKEVFYTKYKKYRNFLSTLMKKSKQAYYDKYFERNSNNIKKTWKGIKSLISLKTIASHVPNILKEIQIILRKHGRESNPLFL